MLEYKGREEDFIRDYCEDNLKAKNHIPAVCGISRVFEEFNFDMLRALVEEMNRYKESPDEALKMLNIKIGDPYSANRYATEVFVNGRKKRVDYPEFVEGSPLSMRQIEICFGNKTIFLAPTDILLKESNKETFVYEKDGTKIIFRKQERQNLLGDFAQGLLTS